MRPDFLAGLRALVFGDFFLADLAVPRTACFLEAERPFAPKMFSQLLEYCLVAPTRVMVIPRDAPEGISMKDWGFARGKPRR